ncbi:MAG: hypothetical protein ABL962_11000, partial [Fimbriimonadaceae bacterium]
SRMVQTALIQQTQLRLLRASCAVVKYRWMNEVYPSTLKAAASTEIITDLVTGLPYRYRVIGSDFEILATGSKKTGDIKLRWRGPVTESGDPPPPRPGSQLPSVRPRSERE